VAPETRAYDFAHALNNAAQNTRSGSPAAPQKKANSGARRVENAHRHGHAQGVGAARSFEPEVSSDC
jgi:hypothetical protein